MSVPRTCHATPLCNVLLRSNPCLIHHSIGSFDSPQFGVFFKHFGIRVARQSDVPISPQRCAREWTRLSCLGDWVDFHPSMSL